MSTIRVRCLLQQCTKATLRLQDESEVTVRWRKSKALLNLFVFGDKSWYGRVCGIS
jgi:hypothetical protein